MKKADFLNYPFNSRRNTVFAKKGIVATSQPLAAQAGLRMLQKGGNAIDAAIATAVALTVVEPTSNGIGGDSFSIVYHNGKLTGLNGSGRSPQSISAKKLRDKGLEKMKKFGWLPVTTPGIPGSWAALSERFGKLDFETLFESAVEYAQNGYPITPTLGYNWDKAYKTYKKQLKDKQFENWFKTFAPKGRAPKVGEIWKSEDHARTLKEIAESKAVSFYSGKIADEIASFSKKFGGYLSKEDLASFEVEWVDPIQVEYNGYNIWELPPNGQGLSALMALGILDKFDFYEKENVETYHKQIEAMKLALTDGKTYITDRDEMSYKVEELLSEQYLSKRRELIRDRAISPEPGKPEKGGTVYLAAADNEGNMISYIQSNYMGFGSGLVVPERGIALQNRGHLFSLDEDHDNVLKGNKKTYHTIIPSFLTKDDKAIGPFGVMGGYMQPQGHLQVIMNTLDFNLNPQAALDAPRWQWIDDKKVIVEKDFPENIAKQLTKKGHEIKVKLHSGAFGRGQIIWKDSQNSVLRAGTEKRTDGTIASY